MNEIILFYVPCPSVEVAQTIAKHLLAKKVVACAQVMPMTSFYWWNGSINNDNETLLIAKTLPELESTVEAEVKKNHPYQIPCIIRIPVHANEEYVKWMTGECKVG